MMALFHFALIYIYIYICLNLRRLICTIICVCVCDLCFAFRHQIDGNRRWNDSAQPYSWISIVAQKPRNYYVRYVLPYTYIYILNDGIERANQLYRITLRLFRANQWGDPALDTISFGTKLPWLWSCVNYISHKKKGLNLVLSV